MIPRMWLPVAVFLAGVACVATAVATGEAEVNLVVIIPVLSGSGWLFLLGTALIIMSFLVGFAVLALSGTDRAVDFADQSVAPPQPAVERKTHYGGVVLIGPVPIAFGSDKRTAIVMLLLGVAMAIALLSILLMVD